MKTITREWLARAAEDLAAAQALLLRYELVRPHHPVIADMDMLDRLESVYIEARYPGDLGLLPAGRPSPEETAEFYSFARDVFERLSANLEDAESDTGADPASEK